MAGPTVDQVYGQHKKRCMDEMFSPTVAVDTCEDNITKPPSTDCFSGIFWLVRI